METDKEYRIESFEDLCNTITMENKDRLLTDVVSAFSNYIQTITEVRKNFPETLKDVPNWHIVQFGFKWYDDGKNDMKGAIVETDKEIFTLKK